MCNDIQVVIRGALDLTLKTARHVITPLSKVSCRRLMQLLHSSRCSALTLVPNLPRWLRTAADGACVYQSQWMHVQVFALPSDALLDDVTLRAILHSGFSRFLVHAPGNKQVRKEPNKIEPFACNLHERCLTHS